MREREVKNKYLVELSGALLLYAAVLVGSLYLAKPMESGATRTLLLVSPFIPISIAIWVIARHFSRMDEFLRLRALEGLAVAAAITAGLTMTYGFLEGAGFPKVSMFWVWPIMGIVWGVVGCVRSLSKQ